MSDLEEPIDARVYRHPLLGARSTVRLEARSLGGSADVEMGVHGFARASIAEAVSRGRAGVEGFVAWAARHHPSEVSLAVTLRRELAVALRSMRSKPGKAKDTIEAIAKRVGASKPAWVAAFLDEASRGMSAIDHAHYAGHFFSRAREAERAHGRALRGRDVDALARLYLDAALRNALSAKEIAHYRDDLLGHEGPAAAYTRLRELLVRRTLGGVPPWSSAIEDLASLARAARRDPEADENLLVRELLSAPALPRAPMAVWQALTPALARLASNDASVHDALLAIVPAMGRDPFEAWLRMLETTGTLVYLADARTPAEIVAWITRLLEVVGQGWSPLPSGLFALVTRVAPRLVASGTPIRLATAAAPEIDLDLGEHVLALGIAIEVDTGSADDPPEINLLTWARSAEKKHPESGKDPIHVVEHPRLAPLVEQAFERASSNTLVMRTSEGSRALATLRRRWLARQVDLVTRAPVAMVRTTLEQIGPRVSRKSFESDAVLHAALAEHDVAVSLRATLHAGLLAELRWPALDDAIAELAGKGRDQTRVFGSWPELVVTRGSRLVVVGPRGIVRRAEVTLAKGEAIDRAVTAEGDVLVVIRSKADRRGVWLDAKTECRPDASYGSGEGYRVAIPGVGVTGGGIALRAGASVEPLRGLGALTDGTTVWTSDRRALVEVDPRTGAKGRASVPRALEGEGALNGRASFLVPMPDGLERSPLGSRDGSLGLRVASVRNELRLERIDGVRMVAANARGAFVLLDVPTRTHRLMVSREHDEVTSYALDPSGQRLLVEEQLGDDDGEGDTVPPAAFLHYAVPSDLAGSEVLSSIDLETCRAVLALARRGALEGPRAREELRGVLPSVTFGPLVDAIAREAKTAVEVEESLAAFVTRCDPSSTDDGATLDDETVAAALVGFVDRYPSGDLERSLRRLVASFEAFDRGEPLPRWGTIVPTQIPLDSLIGRRGLIALLASSPALSIEHRATALSLLSLLETLDVDRFAPRIRSFQAEPGPRANEAVVFTRVGDEDRVAVTASGGSLYLVNGTTWQPRVWRVIELRGASGSFAPPLDCTIRDEQTITHLTHVPPLAALTRASGVRRVTSEDVETFVAQTGASRAVAALVLAGRPTRGDDEGRKSIAAYRDALRLKERDLYTAYEELGALPKDKRVALLDGLPSDPRALWSGAAHAAHRAEAWLRVVGRKTTIAGDVATRLGKEAAMHAPAEWLRVLAEPSASPVVTTDATWGVAIGGELVATDGQGRTHFDGEDAVHFDSTAASHLARVVAWAFVALPVGDSLRDRIPELITLVRARLDAPSLLFDGGALPVLEKGSFEARQKAAEAQLAGYGGVPFPLIDADDGAGIDDEDSSGPHEGRDLGLMLLACEYGTIRVAFRPSRTVAGLTDADRALVPDATMLRVTETWRSAGFDALAARVRETSLARGAYEASPLRSVPRLAREVAASLQVSEDAAAYYLQLLAAPHPTDENVLRWNEWKASQLEAAGAELVACGRAVRGARGPVGRKHFLPDEWLVPKKPSLPTERWRLVFFGGHVHASGRTIYPLVAPLALTPIHELFARSWSEVTAGRGPALLDARAILGRRGRASSVRTPATTEVVSEAPTKKPVAKKPVAKKPVAKKPVAKKPIAKKPVAKKPVAKKPVAKKPVAKKPVARKAPKKKARS